MSKQYVTELLEAPEKERKLEKKDNKYRWTREAGNVAAKTLSFHVVGLNQYNDKGVEQVKNQAKRIRKLNTAYEKVWEPTTGTEKQRTKVKQQKLGENVLYVASIPLEDYLKSFPESYKASKKNDHVDKSLNVFLSGDLDSIYKALAFQGAVPSETKVAGGVKTFIKEHAFYPAVLDRKSEEYDEERADRFDELVKQGKDKAAQAKEVAPIDVNDIRTYVSIGAYVSGKTVAVEGIEVIDVNGVTVCTLGGIPAKNIRNKLADFLDNKSRKNPASLEKILSGEAGRYLIISKLTTGPNAKVSLSAKKAKTGEKSAEEGEEEDEDKNVRPSAARSVGFGFTYTDPDGKSYAVLKDLVKTDNAKSIGILKAELVSAERSDGTRIFSKFNVPKLDNAISSFEAVSDRLLAEAAERKASKKSAKPRLFMEKNLATGKNKKDKKDEEKKGKKSAESAEEEAEGTADEGEIVEEFDDTPKVSPKKKTSSSGTRSRSGSR